MRVYCGIAALMLFVVLSAMAGSNDVVRSRSRAALIGASGGTAWAARVLDVQVGLRMVVMSIGSADGVKPGMRYEVRRGSVPVANVRIVDVRERIAGAVVVGDEGKGMPAVGDDLVLVVETE